MDESKPRRRRFQFTVRKLMLWTTVWAVYLSALRLVDVPLPVAVILTVYLAVILSLRLCLGLKRSLRAVLRVAIGLFFLSVAGGVFFAVVVPIPHVDIVGAMCSFGCFLSLPLLMLIDAIGRVVDWIDNRMETKTLHNE